MKKIFALLLCCMMLLPAALAAETESAPVLTLEEIELYQQSLLHRLQETEYDLTENQDGTYTAMAPLGDVMLSSAQMEEAHVLGASLAVTESCLRGLKVGDSLDMIFQLYPNDNEALLGTFYEATLCIYDGEEETFLGYALRNGQRVTEVTYTVYSRQGDGIVKSGVSYLLDQGYIQQIRLFTAPDMLTAEEMDMEINDSAMVQEATEYQAVFSSENGDLLDPFCREDLYFSKMDFYAITPEEAIREMGSANVDEWMEDSDNTFIRTLQWDGVTMVMKYDAQKNFRHLYSLSVTNENFEGPRGLRIGDYIDTVLFRFLHSQGMAGDRSVVLYGDGENAPYGLISYNEETNTITYTVDMDGEVAMLYLTFRNDVMQEMQLFFNR